MAKNRTSLSPAEEQALKQAIARHNELLDEIELFDNPPKELCIEYYNNYMNNIERYRKAGYISIAIKGVA